MPSILGICETEATKLDVDGKRRAPTRIEEFFGGKAAPESANNVIFHYCRIYFKSLDCIINAIKDRSDQKNFRTYVKLENLLLKVTKGDAFIQEYNDVMTIDGSDFHENKFQVQLQTFQE